MKTKEHLLTCLSEECIEVAKDISKSLRFGLDDRNVLNPTGPTNRERIIEELNDLMGVIQMCEAYGILPKRWRNPKKQAAKIQKVQQFMAYATQVGALEEK